MIVKSVYSIRTRKKFLQLFSIPFIQVEKPLHNESAIYFDAYMKILFPEIRHKMLNINANISQNSIE